MSGPGSVGDSVPSGPGDDPAFALTRMAADPAPATDAAGEGQDAGDGDAALTHHLSRIWTETVGGEAALDAGNPRQTWRPRAIGEGSGAFPLSSVRGRPQPDPFAIDGHGPGARFDLLERIGEGGMGVVWRTRQASLRREIAIKQLKPGDTSAERFLAEAMVTAALDHPNILPVHCLGRGADGTLYLAMKLVRGTSWRRLLRPESADDRRRGDGFSREDHLRILIQVCNAVEYAHSKRLLHRDLKPDNVMVGDFGEVLVVDWGLAVSLASATDEDSSHALIPSARLNRPPAGTPAYMAPEMALARHDLLSERSDIYLLGAILSEILIGRPPHQGRRMLDVLSDAARGHPPAMPVDLPGELSDIVYTAMARDPEDRFPSVAAFRRALDDYLAHRESIDLVDRAMAEAEDLEHEIDGDSYRRYERHARIVARYEQALELWAENEEAISGIRLARLAYAQEASERGDLGLAEAQLGRQGVETAEERDLHQAISAKRSGAVAQQRSARRNRFLLLAALAVLVVGAAATISVMAAASARIASSELAQAQERERRLQAELTNSQASVADAARVERRLRALAPYTEATDLLRRAEMLDNALADDLSRRSRLTDQAIARLGAALQIEPEFIEARIALGEAQRMAGRPQAAAAEFLAADAAGARQGRTIVPALVAAGLAYDAAGEYLLAEQCFAKADGSKGLDQKPSPAAPPPQGVNECLALIGRAFRLTYQERVAEALAITRSTLDAAPQIWECRFAYGHILYQAGNLGLVDPRAAAAEAELHLRTAIDLAPRQAELCSALATVLVGRGGPRAQSEAQRLIDRNVALEPENGARHLWRAFHRRQRGDRAGAAADLAAAEALRTPETLLLMYRAQVASEDGDTVTALACLDRLESLGSAQPEHQASRWLARLRQSQQPGGARFDRSACEIWAAAQVHYPRAWVVRVQALLAEGEVGKAIAATVGGLTVAPFNRELLALQAQLLQVDDRFADSLATCDRYLELFPNDFRLRLLKLHNLIDLRRYGEAASQLNLLASQSPELEPTLAPLRTLIAEQQRKSAGK
ncbi:hypothetical protein LBMAG53_13760 [Planctomycetota bacterium]|nr:hypothetical protein LBMAG53_13760 [Planctomycetota bacterium]